MASLKIRSRVVWAAMQRALALVKLRDRIPRRVPVGKTTNEPIINATRTCFPGTRLRLRYAVQPAPPVSLAFPRPRDRAPAVAPPA